MYIIYVAGCDFGGYDFGLMIMNGTGCLCLICVEHSLYCYCLGSSYFDDFAIFAMIKACLLGSGSYSGLCYFIMLLCGSSSAVCGCAETAIRFVSSSTAYF